MSVLRVLWRRRRAIGLVVVALVFLGGLGALAKRVGRPQAARVVCTGRNHCTRTFASSRPMRRRTRVVGPLPRWARPFASMTFYLHPQTWLGEGICDGFC